MDECSKCRGFDRLRRALEKPITSLNSREVVDAGINCQSICGEVREECVNSLISSHDDREALLNALP